MESKRRKKIKKSDEKIIERRNKEKNYNWTNISLKWQMGKKQKKKVLEKEIRRRKKRKGPEEEKGWHKRDRKKEDAEQEEGEGKRKDK